MSATIAKCTASAIAKRAATNPLVIMRVYGTTRFTAPATTREEWVQDYSSNKDNAQDFEYQDYSSFESTLEKVLEMAQLGKEQESTSYWEQAVRSAYRRRGISDPMAYI
jgi:hypothetical protein